MVRPLKHIIGATVFPDLPPYPNSKSFKGQLSLSKWERGFEEPHHFRPTSSNKDRSRTISLY